MLLLLPGANSKRDFYTPDGMDMVKTSDLSAGPIIGPFYLSGRVYPSLKMMGEIILTNPTNKKILANKSNQKLTAGLKLFAYKRSKNRPNYYLFLSRFKKPARR